MGTETELLNTVKRRKLQYFDHMIRTQNTCIFEGSLMAKGAKISSGNSWAMLERLEWHCHTARQQQVTGTAGEKWCIDPSFVTFSMKDGTGHEQQTLTENTTQMQSN